MRAILMRPPEILIPVDSDAGILDARKQGRAMAAELGFSGSDLTLIATAISELARNIVQHAGAGEITLAPVDHVGKVGLSIVARDQGPGIADVELALQDGYSSVRSLGLGLPGARRLMDEFQIESEAGTGTVVRAVKWVPHV